MADEMNEVDRDCIVAAILASGMQGKGNSVEERSLVERYARILQELRREGSSAHMWRKADVFAQRRAQRRKLKQQSMEETFRDFYENNRWKNPESRSGAGSTLSYTAHLRQQLPIILRDQGIRSMLDAPCGDFNWMKEVRFEQGFTYIGGDIVREMIADNAQKYASPGRSFKQFDVVADEFPDVDMWFCRDLLFHLPHASVWKALRNFAGSRIRFAMITSHINDGSVRNKDIPSPGMFRLLDLRSNPYNFPPPLAEIKDYVDGFPPRNLCLWTREQVAIAIGQVQSDHATAEVAPANL